MRKVFCAFQFFNELEILKIKLEELWDIVDYFVIQESDHTHSGMKKPFYFLEHIKYNDDFNKYKSKIIHKTINDTPSNYETLDKNGEYWYDLVVDKINAQKHWLKAIESYGRDSFEKESLIRGIGSFAKEDDLVILGDCDEIPGADHLKIAIKAFMSGDIIHIKHDFYWYYLNILKDEYWLGNILMDYKTFKERSFCELRQSKEGMISSSKKSGWHFTYMGGAQKIKQKIESWGEQSLNIPIVKDNVKENLKNPLTLGRDLFFRPAKFTKIDIGESTHPKYIVNNLEYFSRIGFIWEGE